MGNCQYCLGKRRKRVTILLVGLDNAGKTTAAKAVRKLPTNSVAPTVGYSSDEFKFEKYLVTLIDVGGGKRIRDIWKNYFAEIHGVIFVVDSSDIERINESKEELERLLSNPLIKGKPLLLLANKQDVQGALDEIDINEKLNLEAMVNEHRTLCKVELTSAVMENKNPAVKSGMKWIVSVIEDDFAKLNKRVQDDVELRELQMREEMAAKRERVRRSQEERAAKETPEIIASASDPVESRKQSRNGVVDRQEKRVKSSLGDELLDDEDGSETHFNLPGSTERTSFPSRFSPNLQPPPNPLGRSDPDNLANGSTPRVDDHSENQSSSSGKITLPPLKLGSSSPSDTTTTTTDSLLSPSPDNVGDVGDTTKPPNDVEVGGQGGAPMPDGGGVYEHTFPDGPPSQRLPPLQNGSDVPGQGPKILPPLLGLPNAADDDVVV